MNVSNNRILIITPARDEGKYIGATIASVVAQTHRPTRWIIIDDNSKDDTATIAEAAAKEHPWITVIRRNSTPQRRVGPGVVEAFYDGLSRANLDDYDYVCKLDADLQFKETYFADLLDRFEKNPRLGTASGKCFIPVNNQFVLERSGDQFSHGVAKLYRRECFQEIGGFVREVMWDGIDCHRCRQFGWEAVSYNDPELAIIHLRQMGSSFRSVYHGRLRWGRGQYFMGTHPLYLLGITAYRMLERPWILGGMCILMGYLVAWMQSKPRYGDSGFRRHLHRWQLRELVSRLPYVGKLLLRRAH